MKIIKHKIIKHKIIKHIVLLSILCVCFESNMKGIYAKESFAQEREYKMVPYVDHIVYKYRKYKGVYQYRRWNQTKNCWVDPHWITV